VSSTSRRGVTGPPLDVIAGTGVWVTVFALSTGPLADRVGLLEGLWLAGPLIVVPTALSLLRPPPGPVRELELARRLSFPAALLLVVSILAQPGTLSALLTVPWVLVAAIALLAGLQWLVDVSSLRAKVIVPVAGLAFLAFAAVNLVAWRGQLRPFELSDTRVAVATVHFTFVGFGASILADRTRAAATRRRSRSAAGAAGITSVIAMAVLGVGYLTDRAFITLVGSIALAAALLVLAVVTFAFALKRDRSAGSAALLVVSSGSVLFALALAVHFAVTSWGGGYSLSPTRMIELHGTVSGLGFVVGGLLGWTLTELPEDIDEDE